MLLVAKATPGQSPATTTVKVFVCPGRITVPPARLDLDGDVLRQELWEASSAGSRSRGKNVAERARALEILLDAVAAHASSNQAWLQDRRFEGLLTPNGKRRAKMARELHALLPSGSDTWRPLREALEKLRVASEDDS
ncbi:hypothetical protein [Nocardioides astragali]|uniref:Uncharacterized protein n=1 Tax=Nocardioides astragali TaxID=1776736 RepID=A0ABW2N465_9ACTN|nr:hypothetical protein [Nocardioides astragali]